MSTLNDNHIDDLMRRASEKYPLRTDSADWDRLADALEKDPSMIPPSVQEDGDGRRRRRFFWLFLLLPLGGLGYYAWHLAGRHSTSQQAIVRLPQAPAATQPGGSPVTGGGNATTGVTPMPGIDTKSGANQMSGGNANQMSGGNANQLSGANAAAVNPPASGATSGKSQVKGQKNVRLAQGEQGSNTTGDKSAGGVNTTRDKASGGISRMSGRSTGGINMTRGISAMSDKSTGERIENETGTWAQQDPQSRNLNLQRALITGDPRTDIKAPPLPVNPAKPGDPAKANAPAKTKSAKNRRLPFYYGILAAPDLSMVKFQSVKGVGYTAGILLGYNINSKLAIETGAYLDKKKYYTEGEYFSRKNVPIPSSNELLNVNGSCNMLEVPINIRYNLNSGGKMRWFATAGLSTYFMFKEAYNYKYQYVWNGNIWDSSYTYKEPSQYWFSVINLSVGFERTLGKVGQLRIEPYWKIPTSGIGKGVLPVMSAGLNIGITRKIW